SSIQYRETSSKNFSSSAIWYWKKRMSHPRWWNGLLSLNARVAGGIVKAWGKARHIQIYAIDVKMSFRRVSLPHEMDHPSFVAALRVRSTDQTLDFAAY